MCEMFGYYVKIGQFCSFSDHNFIQFVKILVLQGQNLSILQFSKVKMCEMFRFLRQNLSILQFFLSKSHLMGLK